MCVGRTIGLPDVLRNHLFVGIGTPGHNALLRRCQQYQYGRGHPRRAYAVRAASRYGPSFRLDRRGNC